MISRRDSLDDKAWSTLFVAWLSPTIQRIVVGIRTNLTQQVSKGPREEDHSTTRGLTSLELSIFCFNLVKKHKIEILFLFLV